MKNEKEIRQQIADLKGAYAHVLQGSSVTVQINAPRALMQVEAEAKLRALHWVLGEKYESKLKGTDT